MAVEIVAMAEEAELTRTAATVEVMKVVVTTEDVNPAVMEEDVNRTATAGEVKPAVMAKGNVTKDVRTEVGRIEKDFSVSVKHVEIGFVKENRGKEGLQ